MVNWSKVIARQTRPPRIVNNYTNAQNSKRPTLRELKPNQTDSKRFGIWNIGSWIWILGTPKVAGYDAFLGARYSGSNTAPCRCLTLNEKCKIDTNSKQNFAQ